MKKKLVILSQYFPPEMGAPQSRLYETAKGLMNLGWEVKIVTAMPNYPTGKIFNSYKNKFSVTEHIEDIEIWRYWIFPSNSKKTIPRVLNMLSFSLSCLFSYNKIRRFKPDYILTESPPLTHAISGLFLSKLIGAKHIMNVSDIWPLSAFELGALSKGILYKTLVSIERFLYRKSFACTGQSQQIINHLNENGCNNTLLFRNGVDIERFDDAQQNLLSSDKSKIRIVYAGLLGVAQGIYDICANINFINLGAEFHIYGDGVEQKDIEIYLRQNPNKGIILHEQVERDSIPELLMSYDVTIIPLIKPLIGAIPSKIYEAMAAGLPIIFACGGEGAEIIKKFNTGWVCTPSDYREIENTITKIVSIPDKEMIEIKNNCIETAHQIFNRKFQLEKLDKFLTETI